MSRVTFSVTSPALVNASSHESIATFGATLLVVSFGADTWEGDPISHFALRTPDYAVLARDIAALGLPAVVVMEGGYAVDALGANVASLLAGFGPESMDDTISC